MYKWIYRSYLKKRDFIIWVKQYWKDIKKRIYLMLHRWLAIIICMNNRPNAHGVFQSYWRHSFDSRRRYRAENSNLYTHFSLSIMSPISPPYQCQWNQSSMELFEVMHVFQLFWKWKVAENWIYQILLKIRSISSNASSLI